MAAPLREWDSQKQLVLPPIKESFNQIASIVASKIKLTTGGR